MEKGLGLAPKRAESEPRDNSMNCPECKKNDKIYKVFVQPKAHHITSWNKDGRSNEVPQKVKYWDESHNVCSRNIWKDTVQLILPYFCERCNLGFDWKRDDKNKDVYRLIGRGYITDKR